MRFMNEYDIEDAHQRYHAHPVLGPATATLKNLMEWTNRNSDGWPYWAKPARAANKLMEMIEAHKTAQYRYDRDYNDPTVAELRKAYVPIKRLLTERKVEHSDVIVPV